ncbi:hypothetical protein EJB05_24386 [Eragrostis curvula]|uniref:Knottin scorpion toxin-like domain-containing protein n=1 Tax=Eragrostis curvula TaxID=38414 RepID=A0A5J9V9M0_9POAL|nr:hypothetical protein EJB05_24386 [Eragrostis curvula]
MAHTSALASLLPLLLMVLLATCAQTDGSELAFPILRRKPIPPPAPEVAPPTPWAKVPKVINIGACQIVNEGDAHAFCIKQCMDKGYVGGRCDMFNGLPGDCSCLNYFYGHE